MNDDREVESARKLKLLREERPLLGARLGRIIIVERNLADGLDACIVDRWTLNADLVAVVAERAAGRPRGTSTGVQRRITANRANGADASGGGTRKNRGGFGRGSLKMRMRIKKAYQREPPFSRASFFNFATYLSRSTADMRSI